MPGLVPELAEQARGLAPDERSRFGDHLLESLRESPLAEVETARAAEIERLKHAHV